MSLYFSPLIDQNAIWLDKSRKESEAEIAVRAKEEPGSGGGGGFSAINPGVVLSPG